MRRSLTIALVATLAVSALLVNLSPYQGPAPAAAAPSLAAPAAQPDPVRLARRAAARELAERVRERRAEARRVARREASRHEIVRVVPGQSVELRDAPGGHAITTVDATTEFGSPTAFSVLERRDGWVGVPTHAVANGELAWIRDDSRLETDTTSMSVHLDLSEQSAEIRDGLRVERRFAITIGAPGSPTPTGTFAVTDELTSGIDPVYGCCAIAVAAIQPNVPADWGGGNRIAIHGTPSDTAGGASSNGCPHATAENLHSLIDALPLGAPVVITR